MTQQTKLLASVAILSLCLCGQAQASSSDYVTPSYIMAESGQSDVGTKDESISIDLNIFSGSRLILFGHRSQESDKTIPQSRTTSIGFSTDPSKKYSLELNRELSTQEQTLEILSNSATLNINLNNWEISVGADRREIQLTTSAEARRLRPNIMHIPIKAQSKWISLGYYGWQTGSVSIYYRKHNYGLRLDQLITAPLWRQRIFSQNSISAVWGLNKIQKGVSLNRYFDRGYFNFSWDEITAEVGRADYSVHNTIRGGYDLTQHWSLEFATGMSSSERETTMWNSVALAYRW